MPLILVQLESSFLFRHPHLSVFNFELESPDRIEAREGGHCTERLSNFILGMGGFWLEARQ